MDPTSIFMADGVWEFHIGLFCPLTFENVEICSADSGGTDLDDDIEGRCHFWLFGFLELQVFVVADDSWDKVSSLDCILCLAIDLLLTNDLHGCNLSANEISNDVYLQVCFVEDNNPAIM